MTTQLPSPAERRVAATTHLLSIFFPLWAPAASFAWHRKRSAFVSHHALHALIDTFLSKALLVVIGTISIVLTILQILRLIQDGWEAFSWQGALVKLVVIWLLFIAFGIWNTIGSLRLAGRALRGEWTKGISGRLAARWADPFGRS